MIDYASGESFRASPAGCLVFVKLDDEVPLNACGFGFGSAELLRLLAVAGKRSNIAVHLHKKCVINMI